MACKSPFKGPMGRKVWNQHSLLHREIHFIGNFSKHLKCSKTWNRQNFCWALNWTIMMVDLLRPLVNTMSISSQELVSMVSIFFLDAHSLDTQLVYFSISEIRRRRVIMISSQVLDLRNATRFLTIYACGCIIINLRNYKP